MRWNEVRDGASDADRGDYLASGARRSRRPRPGRQGRRRAEPAELTRRYARPAGARRRIPARAGTRRSLPRPARLLRRRPGRPAGATSTSPERDNPQAITEFSFGICALGLFVLSGGISFLVVDPGAIVGIVLGRRGMKAVDRGRATKHRRYAKAGFVDRDRDALAGGVHGALVHPRGDLPRGVRRAATASSRRSRWCAPWCSSCASSQASDRPRRRPTPFAILAVR